MFARSLWCVFACVSLLAAPGCVVWDIKDQIALSNENLTSIEKRLDSIDRNLEVVNGNLDSMGGTLGSMDTQLVSLQAQLDATNEHLASLRKTINNIDQTIPFMSISGDSETEQERLEVGTPATEPTPAAEKE